MLPRKIEGSRNVSSDRASLIVIGNFDGVHLGHRTVIQTALAQAERDGLVPRVLTFEPHPSRVLGGTARPALTLPDRKVELLLRCASDRGLAPDPSEADPNLSVVVEPFTHELSRLSPSEFVESILVQRLHARTVIVGENFRFGRDRVGDLRTLRALGEQLGFDAHAEPLVGDELGVFSSTRARAALELGDLAGVARCLGRPHALSGPVISGAQRGRTLGFPTANLAPVLEALPPFGVYACLVDRVEADGARVLGRGVMNLGMRPTVDAGFSVEVHVLDFAADLYGAELRVHLMARLREERKFEGLAELRAQITLDSERAREALANYAPDPRAGGAWF
ncbi:MAG TPA: bifunctional riboflavin kinase/FAD synthetase [Polyangiaceae bacterium]|nr:bifunctional riboflavin kinase/FAD synthetase [Polyangiaceae bacterium]